MNIKKLTKALLCSLMVMTLASCSIDNDDKYELYRPTALVTARTLADGTFTLQLDDMTVLYPTNLKTSPFGNKEVRALVNYTTQDKAQDVYVNWIDSIRTKMPVPTLNGKDAEVYGNDPVEIVRDWVTVAEDGYLTLRVRTVWGNSNTKHYLELVSGVNPENPYEFDLRHNAHGDVHGYMADAMIAFNLNDLPRESADPIKIKVNWISFSGKKSTEFELAAPALHTGNADMGRSNMVE